MALNFNINIDKDGLSNKDIKILLEHIKDISSRDIKSLCNGNSFSVKQGENGFKVTFTQNFNNERIIND